MLSQKSIEYTKILIYRYIIIYNYIFPLINLGIGISEYIYECYTSVFVNVSIRIIQITNLVENWVAHNLRETSC